MYVVPLLIYNTRACMSNSIFFYFLHFQEQIGFLFAKNSRLREQEEFKGNLTNDNDIYNINVI